MSCRYAQRVLGSKQAAFGELDTLTLVQQLQRQLTKTGQRQLALRYSFWPNRKFELQSLLFSPQCNTSEAQTSAFKLP